jgi:hypothetical protein
MRIRIRDLTNIRDPGWGKIGSVEALFCVIAILSGVRDINLPDFEKATLVIPQMMLSWL